MKKLHRLFLLSFVGPFIITFVIVLFLLVMQFLWKYMDDMIGKGLEIWVILKLLFFASANLVPIALPIATLLASIMTLGNFGENYELIAIKSSGISLFRSLRPLMLTALGIGIGAFIFTNNVWPVANLKMKALLYDITQKKPALDIKENIYYREIEGYVIHVKSKGKDGQTLYGVTIYDHGESSKNNKIIKADSGIMRLSQNEKNLILTMYNGFSWEELESTNEQRNNYPLFRTYFKEESVLFDMSAFAFSRTDETMFKDNYEMLNLSQLSEAIDTTDVENIQTLQKFAQTSNEQLHFMYDTAFQLTTVVATDTLLTDVLSYEKKQMCYQNAKNMLRNSKTYFEIASQNLESNQNKVRRYKIEWHRKFAVSYVCFILFFIGAPLGAIIRKGGFGMPVIVSILIFIFYYVISIVGEKLVKQGELDAVYGMWIASVILTPVAIFLTYKSNGDSRLFEISFGKWVKRVMGRKDLGAA